MQCNTKITRQILQFALSLFLFLYFFASFLSFLTLFDFSFIDKTLTHTDVHFLRLRQCAEKTGQRSHHSTQSTHTHTQLKLIQSHTHSPLFLYLRQRAMEVSTILQSTHTHAHTLTHTHNTHTQTHTHTNTHTHTHTTHPLSAFPSATGKSQSGAPSSGRCKGQSQTA